ncbi:hypothetical protein ACI2L1_34100 [Streptomyces sp. NPDC019531]|uniref:hypothetical protein n=1 Tax=Streptomyces sp. NPDC019531 TaxID=3365062 RepID=UPI00384CD6F4
MPGPTHPFTAGCLAFAHNGFFSPYDALDELIAPGLLSGAAGSTDSERFFLRVLTLLRDKDPVEAPAGRRRHTGPHVLREPQLSADDRGDAVRDADDDTRSEVTMRRGPGYFRLRYQADGGRVVGAWSVLPYRRVLEVRRDGLGDVCTRDGRMV